MTPEQIHDALTLLPADLITEADKVRSTPRKMPLRLRSRVAAAACAALVLLLGTFAMQMLPLNMTKTAESIAEAPAAAAPEAPNAAVPEDMPVEMQKEAADMDTIVLTPTGEPEEAPDRAVLDSDHFHGFADAGTTKNSTAATGGAYCGNTKTTIHIGGESVDVWGSDSITITRILDNLDYDPNKVCRCMAPITVDTELISGIEVHLGEAFARCEQGQADLTEGQTNTLREIFNQLGEVTEPEPTETTEEISIDLERIQYLSTPCRPNSSLNLEGDPRTSLVTSAGALYDYYVKYCEIFYMDAYFAATVPYNRAWFLENDLLILRIGAPHSEFHYDVTAFTRHPDTEPAAWQITLSQNPDEPTDIAFDNNSMWHILIPVPKGTLPEDAVILIDFE